MKPLKNKQKKQKSKSRGFSKQSYEKKAISLATKMIKQSSRVNFQMLKLNNDPLSTRLMFIYFVEDLSNLLDMFQEIFKILTDYPTINPTSKHDYARKKLFTLINSYKKYVWQWISGIKIILSTLCTMMQSGLNVPLIRHSFNQQKL